MAKSPRPPGPPRPPGRRDHRGRRDRPVLPAARTAATSGPAEPVLPESAGLSAGSSGDAETGRQVAGRGPELAASERLEAIAEHAAIEAGAVAGERHRL